MIDKEIVEWLILLAGFSMFVYAVLKMVSFGAAIDIEQRSSQDYQMSNWFWWEIYSRPEDKDK